MTFPLRQGQDFPLRVWRSQPLGRTIEFDLESGDIVLDCQGLVWATVDGQPDDIMLAPGDTYEVTRHQRMRFNGFDDARMVLLARGPVAVAAALKPWNRTVNHWASAFVERWVLGGRGLSA